MTGNWGQDIDHDRRRLLCSAALGIAGAQLGTAMLAHAASGVRPTAGQGAGSRRNTAFDVVSQIDAGVLNVGYVDLGPRDGNTVLLLHGWPYSIHSYVEVAPLLVSAGYRVIVPYLRGYGTTRFRSSDTPRNGQQAALATDAIDLMDVLKVDKAIVAGFDWGARTAVAMCALWPERCKALVSVSGYIVVNLERNKQPLPPAAELGWWYQYYFSTDRGRLGYERHRHEFARLIWKLASPRWVFDEAIFHQSAMALDNPDHVDIVIHNYRWRLGLAPGEQRYAMLEQRLQEAPPITVPAITIGSDFDGAAADGKPYAAKFTGQYSHRVLDGIGHDVPTEAPEAFAKAILDVHRS